MWALIEGIDKCERGSVAALGTELTPPVTDAMQPGYTQIQNFFYKKQKDRKTHQMSYIAYHCWSWSSCKIHVKKSFTEKCLKDPTYAIFLKS